MNFQPYIPTDELPDVDNDQWIEAVRQDGWRVTLTARTGYDQITDPIEVNVTSTPSRRYKAGLTNPCGLPDQFAFGGTFAEAITNLRSSAQESINEHRRLLNDPT